MLRGKRIWVACILAVLCIGVFAPTAFAQAQQDPPEKTSYLELLGFAGPIGWLLVVLNFVGYGLIIEHLMSIRRDNLVPPDLLNRLEELFEEEDYEEVMNLCESQPNFLTNVIASGLPRIGSGYEGIRQAMDEVSSQESTKLHQKISYLNLISNTAPMLGLFGTVSGMIGAFDSIAKATTSPKPSELAGGIQQALVTTFLGLLVAIPISAAFFFFRNRVIRVIMEINSISDELMERFREAE